MTIYDRWRELAKRKPHYLKDEEWNLIYKYYASMYNMMLDLTKDYYSEEKYSNTFEMISINIAIMQKRLDSKKIMIIWQEFYSSIDELREDLEMIEDYDACRTLRDFKKLFEMSECR